MKQPLVADLRVKVAEDVKETSFKLSRHAIAGLLLGSGYLQLRARLLFEYDGMLAAGKLNEVTSDASSQINFVARLSYSELDPIDKRNRYQEYLQPRQQ
jgi:hypothetical protein